jgi:hypothetical protein
MMMLTSFGFIVKAPGYSALQHHAQLLSEKFSTRVVGVADLAEAIWAARNLIAEGVQLIELCGGFSESDRTELENQTGHEVPVGVVVYNPTQEAELVKLFG